MPTEYRASNFRHFNIGDAFCIESLRPTDVIAIHRCDCHPLMCSRSTVVNANLRCDCNQVAGTLITQRCLSSTSPRDFQLGSSRLSSSEAPQESGWIAPEAEQSIRQDKFDAIARVPAMSTMMES